MKRVLIFFGVSVTSVAVVFAITYSPETLDALRQFDLRLLAAIVGVWATAILGAAFSFFFMARATGSRLRFVPAVKAAFMRILFNLLTPFGFGGGPFVVYYLDHHEVPAGKGSSIVLTQMMVVSILVFSGAVAGFVLLREQLLPKPFVMTLLSVTGTLQLGGVVVILLVLTYPNGVIKLISWIGRLLHRLKVVKEPDRFRRRVIHEGSVARRSFRRYFTHHPVDFSLGALGMGIVYCSEVMMLFLVFRSLGHPIPVGTGLAMTALFYMALSYMPTPGSSGLGEGIFVALFAGFVPSHTVGIAVILWRVFYSYASSLTGAVFASHHFAVDVPKRRRRLIRSKRRSGRT